MTFVSLYARTVRAQANLTAGSCSMTTFVGAPAGGSIPVSFSFANTGPSPVTDFSLYEMLGSYLTIGSIQHVPAGVTCTVSNPNTQNAIFQCTSPTFPVAQDSISFVLNVSPNAPPETTLPVGIGIIGSDVVKSIGCGPDQDKTAFVLGPSDPLVSVVQVLPTNANAGTTLSTTADVVNNGPYHCRDAIITITATNGSTPLPMTNVKEASHAWTCTGTTQVVCSGDVIPAGGNAVQITFSTALPQDISGTVVTTVSVSSPEDTNTSNNTKSTTTTIIPPPPTDVSVSIAASPTHPAPGENVTYTIGMNNSGAAAALGVTLGVSDSANLPRVSSTLPCNTTTCNLGTMAAGESRTYTVVVHAPSTPGAVTATATTSASNDATPANNQATANFQVVPHHPDLAVAINAPSVVQPGTAQWAINVSNLGPDTARDSILTFQTPPGTTFASFVGASASLCSGPPAGTAGLITCNGAGLLPVAAQWNAIIQLNVLPTAASPIHAAVSVATTDVDPNAMNNSASADTQFVDNLNAAVDLSLAISTTPTVVHVGDVITFSLSLTNNGDMTANDVVIHQTLPSDLAFISGSAGCDSSLCSVGALASGQTVTVNIVAVANSVGYATTDAHVMSATTDMNDADNVASQGIIILPMASSRRRSTHH